MALYVNRLDNRSRLNGNNNLDNDNGRLVGIAQSPVRNYKMYERLCSHENLLLAFNRARKGKNKKHYVIKFRKDLDGNLLRLREELISMIYKPRSLKTFILRDPKTRKISRSKFRDRVVHHTIINVIGPLFNKSFIYDSYANQIGKGSHGKTS